MAQELSDYSVGVISVIDLLTSILLTARFWDTFFGGVTAASTFALAIVAWHQLHKISDNQRRWSTLQACDRYDSDPIIVEQQRLLRRVLKNDRGVGDTDVRFALNTLLNYFDAIAIGIDQKLYLDEIANMHLGQIIKNWFDRLAQTRNMTIKNELTTIKSDYKKLCQMYENWFGEAPEILAKDNHVGSDKSDQ